MTRVLAAFAGGLVLATAVTVYVMRRQAAQQAPSTAQPALSATVVETPPPVMAEAPPVLVQEAKPAPAPRKRPATRTASARPAPAPPVREQEAAPAEPAAPGVTAEAAPAPDPIAPPPAQAAAPPPESPILRPERSLTKPEPRLPREVTVPAGTLLTVRLSETVSSERQTTGETFSATLDQPLVVDGFVIAERGARVEGKVIEALRSGRVKGRARLGIELSSIMSSDGQKVDVQTEAFVREAEASQGSDAAKVGVLAGIGAAIGAIAGGGKGAAVGAAAGGAAGTGGVLATRGKPAELQVETRISFKLREPVSLREKLN